MRAARDTSPADVVVGARPAPAGFWQSTLDALPDSIAVLNSAGEIVAVNQAWRLFALEHGAAPPESRWGVGANYFDACEAAASADPSASRVTAALRAIIEGRSEWFESVYSFQDAGGERWFSVRITPFRAGEGRRVVVVHHDITARRRAEQQIWEHAELLNAVDAAVVAFDSDHRITHWSLGAEALHGWSAQEAIGQTAAALGLIVEGPDTAGTLAHGPGGDGSWQGRMRVRDRHGHEIDVFTRGRRLYTGWGEPRGVLTIAVDISSQVATEERLRHAQEFLSSVTSTVPVGLYVLDEAGHLTMMNPKAEQLLGWRSAELLGERVHDFTHPVDPSGVCVHGQDCPILRVVAGGDAVDVEDDGFRRRDGSKLAVSYSVAPFATPSGSRGSIVAFTEISDRKERELRLKRELEALSWAGRINDALREDRFVLHAQPVVELATGRPSQHELLLRMVGEDGELILPGVFLPTAEQHGLSGAIDRWVLRKAVEYARRGLAIEINLSSEALGDPSFLGLVRDLLEQSSADPSKLVFEIKETALIGHEVLARGFVEDVRRLGCSVALDGFGTGYGSFRYLKQLPVSLLKIDQEFVRDLDGPDAHASRHVIEATVGLARGMGQRTVAEGVETEAALEALRELDVDYVQGFLLGRPRPADELLT